MRILGFAAGVCAALLTASPSIAMTDTDCAAEWKKIDSKGTGYISEADGRRYFAAMRVANKPVVDGKLTQAAFVEQCKADLFTIAKTDPNAPLAGANSFTEAQAIDRAIAAGFSPAAGLKKDDKGVWRGSASDGTKTVPIAVDYKGNVVAK